MDISKAEKLDRKKSKSRIKDLKLNMLLEVTKGINNNASSESLFEIFESILKTPLGIGRAIMFLKNSKKKWEQVLGFGVDEKFLNIDVEKQLTSIYEIQFIETSTKADNISSFDSVIPIVQNSVPLAYILLGDLDEQELRISPIIKHLPFIQTLGNVISVAIENKRLEKENVNQKLLQKELELASEMQSMLFPTTLPNNDIFEVQAEYLPHSKVGGDYYDFIKINDDESVFCVADVSGKGMSAAILMANFQANLRAMLRYFNTLEEVVEELNSKVIESANGERFVTLFLAVYNNKTRILKYINAAHYPPLLINKNRAYYLEEGCTGVGMLDVIPQMSAGRIKLDKNAILICYTDGIVDLANEQGEDFDLDKIEVVARKNINKPILGLNKQILNQLENHRGTMPYVDDIALLSCRFL